MATNFLLEARENAADGFKEVEERAERLGSAAHWESQFAEQMLKFRTCDLCGKVCRDQIKLEYTHRNSKACLQQQAENKGEVYTPISRERVTCECGKEVYRCNLVLHKDSDGHKRKMQNLTLTCQFCNKQFLGKRPKRDYLKHCKGARHMKKVALAKNPVVKKI